MIYIYCIIYALTLALTQRTRRLRYGGYGCHKWRKQQTSSSRNDGVSFNSTQRRCIFFNLVFCSLVLLFVLMVQFQKPKCPGGKCYDCRNKERKGCWWHSPCTITQGIPRSIRPCAVKRLWPRPWLQRFHRWTQDMRLTICAAIIIKSFTEGKS